MAGYIRQDVSNNIANGNVIDADDFDSEFDAIAGAFNTSTGHTHDGSSAEGAPITVIGPAQDVVVSATAVTPKSDDTYDLGSVSNTWKDLYVGGIAYVADKINALNDSNTNIRFPSVDTFSVETGGLERLRVSDSGNVGIGNTAPFFPLDIQNQSDATLRVRASGTEDTDVARLRLQLTGNVGNTRIEFGDADSTSIGRVTYNHATDSLSFTVNSSEAARFTNSGNLGIGTTSPSEKLSVSGNATVSGTMTVGGSTVTTATNTQTLTNKTLTNPTINTPTITGGSISGITDLAIADGGTGASTAAGALVNLGLTATAAELNIAATNYIPSGGVIMWSGTIAAIPSGWALCDGGSGTPDLRGRMVIGAGGAYAVGAIGGNETVTLSSAQLPAHTHTFSGTTTTNGAHTHDLYYGVRNTGDGGWGITFNGSVMSWIGANGATNLHTNGAMVLAGGAHAHTFSGTTSSVGSGTAVNILNPYYALAYIMKL